LTLMEHYPGLTWFDYEQTPTYVVHRMVEVLNARAKEQEAERSKHKR
jgi:hypothetical protein